MILLRLAILAALLPTLGCDRCHQGFSQTRFYEARTSYEYTYDYFSGEYRWQWVHHPEHCSTMFVCLEKCVDIDAGKMEAHAEHEVLKLTPEIDQKCK